MSINCARKHGHGDIKENLAETMKILGTLTEEILGLLEKEKDIEHEITDWNKFRRDIRKGIQKIEDYLKPTSGSAGEQNSNPPPTANQAPSTQQTTCNQTVRARLPKLELKKFFGSVADWQSFWDAFRNAVHENSQLFEIDKFTYLKGLLGGEASTAIAGLSLTQGNYGAAIEILKKRFGEEQKIISAHMEMLLKLTPVHNGKETGIQADSYGTLLVPVLLLKLPDDVKLEISRGVEDGKWNLDDLLKKLIAEITARERCTTTPVNPAISFGPKKPARPTTSTFLAPNGGEYESRCAFCMGLHKHVDCRKIARVAERKQIAKRFGRCFLCLGRGHKAVCCDSKEKCYCGGRHHLALCESKFRESREENRVPENARVSGSQKPEPGSILHVNSRARVVLQTAQAIASTSSVTKAQELRIRVIFDSGSQRSYVTNKVANLLQLNRIGSEMMETGTFGQAKAMVTELELVAVHLGHLFEEGTVQVEAFKVPVK